MRISILVLMLMILAGAAQADLFPCSEEGVNAAIAEAALGNAGPHALDCSPGDSFQTVTGFGIRNDLILDGRGVTIECYRESPQSFGCRNSIVVARELICNRIECGENVWGPPPNVSLEDFNLVATGAALENGTFVYVEGILISAAANLGRTRRC